MEIYVKSMESKHNVLDSEWSPAGGVEGLWYEGQGYSRGVHTWGDPISLPWAGAPPQHLGKQAPCTYPEAALPASAASERGLI